MAERRMFAKSIVTGDAFLDMPSEAQALYLQLCMAADDDGFVDNPRSVMRSCGASNDSMKLLIAKKFALTFEKGDTFLLVIKHWRVNNYIAKDRYHETRYKEVMRELYYDENKSYSTNPEGHTPCLNEPEKGSSTTCIQPVYKMDTQVRLGKDSIGKDNGQDSIEGGLGETTQPGTQTYGINHNVILTDSDYHDLVHHWGETMVVLRIAQVDRKIAAGLMEGPAGVEEVRKELRGGGTHA